MSLNELTGPVIHVGVSASLALVFRLNPAVTIFCGILPDLVDKPLAVLGIGGGRYIGHTLLFAGVMIILFTVWKKKYGLAALIGLTSHLLLDLNAFIPWFYPFKEYRFYTTKLSIIDWLKGYLTSSEFAWELIIVVVVILIIFVGRWLYKRYTIDKQQKR
jgi:hypothetical protein